jgi:hypothetical protein
MYPALLAPLPAGLQPPDPCRLLTTKQLAAATGERIQGPKSPGLASAWSTNRECTWMAKGSPNGRFVAVDIWAAATEAAATTIRKQVLPAGYLTTAQSLSTAEPLPVLYGQLGYANVHDTPMRLLGYHADFTLIDLWDQQVRVLTPTAMIRLISHGVGDESTLTRLVTLMLGGLNLAHGTWIDTATTTPDYIPMAIQPPDPCRLLTTQEVSTTLATTFDDPGLSPLATKQDSQRQCVWLVSPTEASGRVGPSPRKVTLVVDTASARAASGPNTATLSLLFHQDDGLFTNLIVAGYPAHYHRAAIANTGVIIQGVLQVLTPTALVEVNLDGTGDLVGLTKLAGLALQRLASTRP